MSIKMMRYALSLILVMGVAAGYAQEGEVDSGATTPSRRVVLDKIVAVVGNSSILLSDVKSLAARIEEEYRSNNYTSDRDVMAESLEELMTQKLLSTQARIDSLDANLSQVNAQIVAQIDQMRDAAGGVKELERIHNMEIFNIRDILRRRLEENSFARAMQNEVTQAVKVIPGEVEQFYKRQDRDSLPMIGEQYRYAQITRFPKSMDDAKRRVVERLLEMRAKVIDGSARFTSLAQMYSVDPGSAYRGGEMEPQPSSAFVAPFAEALEMLKPGQVSEVVETDFGYHIIELIDKRGELYHCRHILLRPSYSATELMEPTYMLDSLVKEIRRDSISFERAALIYSDDAMTKMNGGIVTNQDLLERYNAYDAKLTVSKFLKEDFGSRGYKSLDDFTELSKLKVGEVSNSFITEDMMGNHISKIVKLVEVFPAHVASIEEDYLQIEAMALAEKQDEVLNEWLKRHIATTYVYIAPEFRKYEFENEGWVR